MARRPDPIAVRPLPGEEARPPPGPLRLGLIVMTLVAGALVGWLAGLSGARDATPVATPVDDAASNRLADGTVAGPVIDWSTATSYPDIPTGSRLDGFTGVAEIAGSIYVTANMYDATTGTDRPVMWSSTDGAGWEDLALDLGAGAWIDQITAYGDTLLVAGTRTGAPVLWRSISKRAIGGTSWTEISLDEPAAVAVRKLSVAVGRNGEVVVVAAGAIDLTDRVVGPYLPPGIELGSGHYRYYGDRWLVAAAPDADGHPIEIELFAESPQVVVADNRAWTRVVTNDGVEHLATFPLPDDLHYTAGVRDGVIVDATKVWTSGDASAFHSITGPDIVPAGAFAPVQWMDRFVAAGYGIGVAGADDATVVWETHRGAAWRPLPSQPPNDCVPFSLAVSGGRLLAVSDGGIACLRDGDAAWEVLGTRQSGVGYLTGGEAGFVRYPRRGDYRPASFSRDGASWVSVAIPAAEPYPMLAVLQDRLVTLSVGHKPDAAPQPQIWLGAIE